jgi:putative cell wall-binding protein
VKRFLPVILGFLVLLLIPSSAWAHHKEAVLGEATSSSELVFPPITAGTGFILPDSPLFFADKIFQQVKIVFAFSPEQKARVRAQIAEERMAELRLMMARNHQNGINTAIFELTKEVDLTAESLSDAGAQGKNVAELAREINERIKLQRKILHAVEKQTGGVLRLQLKSARQALKEAKIEVEDELSDEEIEREVEEDLAEEVEDELEDASESAKTADLAIARLEKEASKSAAKSLTRREEAVKKALLQRNETLKKVEERLLENEKKRQENLLEARKKASEQAREALEKAAEANKGLRKAQEKVRELRTKSIDETSDSGSGSDNSGSGSTSSGSGSSGSSGGEDED